MKNSTRLCGKRSFSSPKSWAAKVLLCAKIKVGFCNLLMTFAITKVLPLPVIPRSVCLSLVLKFASNWSIAVCWPGEILYGETSSNCNFSSLTTMTPPFELKSFAYKIGNFKRRQTHNNITTQHTQCIIVFGIENELGSKKWAFRKRLVCRICRRLAGLRLWSWLRSRFQF